ncbi:MAG: N-acetyl-gamma-glutamyl-phosphate reductase [Crocinitomicaceae bacterium]|nr:N-acetyl-gamma-glutamyl-phosphate reductase [Crocinitomicaceae bacterium]
MISVGIVGSAGYVAGELIRSLVHHPKVKVDFLFSHSSPDVDVSMIHQDMLNADLLFTQELNHNVDIVFLCLGHGNSKKFLTKHRFSETTRIIDLGNDFRLKDDASFNGMDFVYGLVEWNKRSIKETQYIANPGCFATAIQLALLPLAKEGLLTNDVHINAITGSTGAGQSLSSTSHFSWRNNNISMYKEFKHQHLGEIGETLLATQSGFDHELNFLPVRGDFSRGIFASAYMKCKLEEKALIQLFEGYYQSAEFTHVFNGNVHLKQVVNTNNCALQIQKVEGKILITSVIDNLLKGAAGQAIQNMNIMFDLPENTGLAFKANYF